MRTTGIIVAVIGLMIAVYCGITMMMAKGDAAQEGALSLEKTPAPDLTLPLVIAGAAMCAGVLMYAFGGRGVWVTRNPAVRN